MDLIALSSCLVDYQSARVAESADAGDSKSLSLRGVRVQVPPRAQQLKRLTLSLSHLSVKY